MAGLTPLERATMDAIMAEEIARAKRIQEHWRLYNGEFPDALPRRSKEGGKPKDRTLAAVAAEEPDDNVKVNKCKVIVDKGVSWLFGQEVTFELEETEQTDAETWLDLVWSLNRKMSTLQKFAMNGAIAGHAFAKVIDRGIENTYPRVVILDPETVTPFYEDDDIESVYRYKIQWNTIDRTTGRPLVRRQIIERSANGRTWTIADFASSLEQSGFQATAEPVLWPYPFAPIVATQNLPNPNEYWGLSDLEKDLIDLNKSKNFNLSNWNRVQRYYGHPKVVGRGFRANQMERLSSNVDDVIVLPNADGSLDVLAVHGDSVGAGALDDRIDQAIHEIGRVPVVATGKVQDLGALSGVALEILFQPLIEKTQQKRTLYGEFLTDLNRILLTIGRQGNNLRPVNHWPDVLPNNDKEFREILLVDKQLGASRDSVLEKAGYDPEIEKKKRANDAAESEESLARTFAGGSLDAEDEG